MNLEDITPELREKAKECTTTDELMELAEHEGIDLSDEALNAFSGGFEWFGCANDTYDETCPKLGPSGISGA